jgi:UDP-glucose 4-epimerase
MFWGVRIVKGNVPNLSELVDCIRTHNIDRIAHLAGLLTQDSEKRPFESIYVNAIASSEIRQQRKR